MQQLLSELSEMRTELDDIERLRDMNEHLKELLSEKTEELARNMKIFCTKKHLSRHHLEIQFN